MSFSRREGARFNRGRIATAAGGSAAIAISQDFLIDAAPTTLGVIDISTQFVTAATGSTSSLTPPQLRVQVQNAAITLGGTMRASGTTPPVVTLTGTLAFAAGVVPGIRVEITLLGVRGVAQFRVSYNSGSTWAYSNQATAATYPLDGLATGVTLNFANSTYAADNVYEGTLNVIRSTEGNSYTFTQAANGNQPLFRRREVAPDGKDAIFNGNTNQGLISTDAALIALFTNDPAITVMCRVHYGTADAIGYWISACSSAQPTNTKRIFGQSSAGSSGLLRHSSVSDGGSSQNNTTTADPSFPSAAHNECWTFAGGGGAVTCTVDDANRVISNTPLTIAATTPDRVAICYEADSTPGQGSLNTYMYDWCVFDKALNSGEATAWDAALTAGT